eukprot:37475-Prymnesium_polylepis.1
MRAGSSSRVPEPNRRARGVQPRGSVNANPSASVRLRGVQPASSAAPPTAHIAPAPTYGRRASATRALRARAAAPGTWLAL